MVQYVSVCCVWPSFLPFLWPCSQDAYSKLGEFRREFVFLGVFYGFTMCLLNTLVTVVWEEEQLN